MRAMLTVTVLLAVASLCAAHSEYLPAFLSRLHPEPKAAGRGRAALAEAFLSNAGNITSRHAG